MGMSIRFSRKTHDSPRLFAPGRVSDGSQHYSPTSLTHLVSYRLCLKRYSPCIPSSSAITLASNFFSGSAHTLPYILSEYWRVRRMESLELPTKAASAQAIGSVNSACYFIAMTQFISAIVFLQYVKFYSLQTSRQSQLSYRLGTAGILLHLGQVVVDLWSIFHSFQYYASGKPYTYFLYEALQTAFSVGIILVVQYHFFQVAHATSALSKHWAIPLGIIYLGACVAGLGAAFEFFGHFRHSGFSSATPLVLRGKLLSFYVIWLSCNGIADSAITFAMVKALYQGRGLARHKSLRSTLRRLLSVIINTFFLTYLAANLSLLAAILPRIIPNFSIKAEVVCQTVGVFLNGLLSRIYLISFFCSF
ncbi:hypothetical protein PTTG_12413 [Puccinia triticina 1-1 BBBD Race 1]|uniref:THH1/TOM1/TOM3 domain-containing protein n=2 Tax=Puccinia triticina TaxID=208348 RepID=A0A180GN42_PUCT1|nr:hypothetical protein PTTG_12413 [Puccinia triticina 1-1 BBBD Race 1]